MSGHPNTAEEQRVRILARLRQGPLNTLRARSELDVMHPAARVMELRAQGHIIETLRTREYSECGQLHCVAHYVLRPALLSGEQLQPAVHEHIVSSVNQETEACAETASGLHRQAQRRREHEHCLKSIIAREQRDRREHDRCIALIVAREEETRHEHDRCVALIVAREIEDRRQSGTTLRTFNSIEGKAAK